MTMTAKKDTYISEREARLEDENMRLHHENDKLRWEIAKLKEKLQRRIPRTDKTQKMGRPIDTKLHAKIWKYREEGYSIRIIADMVGCSTATVQKVVNIMKSTK